MSTNPLDRRFFSRKAGFVAARTVLAACAALVLSIPSLWADAAGQTADATALGTFTVKTIHTATAAQLGQAVSIAILSNTNLTPADLTASVFQPYPITSATGTTRTTESTDAPIVTGSAIHTLLSSTSTSVSTDIGALVDAVITVNGTFNGTKNLYTTKSLTVAGQENVIKAALGIISDSGTTNALLLTGNPSGFPGVLPPDQAIGQALAADATLETGSTTRLLNTILQIGIEGITGTKAKSTSSAPLAAEDFVKGLLTTGTVPDAGQGATYNSFAVAILKNVATNASVDELVSNAIGNVFNTVPELITTGTALNAKYTTAPEITKVVQGLAAAIPAGTGTESGRTTYVQNLTTLESKNAVDILEGAVYVDPYYANEFTAGSFTALNLLTATGTTGAPKDAIAIATGVGSVLGQDGNELTQVANIFAEYLAAKKLPLASAATYAMDLVNGAVTSKVLASQFTGAAAGGGGGTLPVNTGLKATSPPITQATGVDLASIVDLFAGAIITANGSSATTTATDIGTLIEDIAKIAKLENITITVPGVSGVTQPATQEPVGVYLAGTLGEYLSQLTPSITPAALTAIFTAIAKDVQVATNAAIGAQVKTTLGLSGSETYTDYTDITGPVSVQETTVTNL